MTLRCASCQSSLKVDEQKLAGRTTARCPKCQATIQLTGSTGSTAAAAAPAAGSSTTVSCAGCGARLKLPAGARPARSRCPRCGGTIDLTNAEPAERVARPHDDSSSAATRRIDSRALGMEMATGGHAGSPSLAPPGFPIEGISGRSETPAPPDPTFTRPAVVPMRNAALEIRDAAHEMRASFETPAEGASAPASPIPGGQAAVAPAETAKAPETRARAASPSPAGAPRPSGHAARPSLIAHPFPLSRGAFAGVLAGAILGLGLWAAEGALAAAGFAWLMTSVPLSQVVANLPEPLARLILLAVSGGLVGIIAAGAGSPAADDRPLRLVRCLVAAMLPGLVMALLSVLLPAHPEEGFVLWPAIHWMRDILLAGLLTPLVNRLLPSGS
jgi:predicted Zn finger-like uncharacterized protein